MQNHDDSLKHSVNIGRRLASYPVKLQPNDEFSVWHKLQVNANRL